MKKKSQMWQPKPIVLTSCDPEVWRKVAEAKQVLVETGQLPDDAAFIPEEIVEMWRRSIRYGIRWDKPIRVPKLSKSDFERIKEKKSLFIEVATGLIEEFQEILEGTDFTMSITDENGILLSKTNNSDKIWNDFLLEIGDVWSEEYVGCTAHTLALAYSRPIQIMGPANFYKFLESNLSSAAPIFNEYGDTIGSIRLVQRNADITRMMTHTLGWVTSVASAISSQLKLFRRDKRLKLMNSTLKATFAHIEDGYISIDDSGRIININKEAARLLNLPGDTKINFFSILSDSAPLINTLNTGRAVLDQHLMLKTDSGAHFVADIEPFHGDSLRYAQGAVIRIRRKTEAQKTDESVRVSSITFDRIIGNSQVMETLKDTAKMVSRKPINILLLGESGTGKEVFAQAIHNYYYKSGPFVAINCASIPANLIESELFGYESGAFTGAEKAGRKGKIEYANGGTLFLDEIGDMPTALQPVLLRVLEEKRVTRIGGNKSIPVDFRIISATNKPLCGNFTEEKFRQDLYFRLAVVKLELPPLRERGKDILLLADNFIKNTCNNFNMPVCTLAKETEKILMEFPWPGNVRQLQNAMIYAVTVAAGRIIMPKDLPQDITGGVTYSLSNKLDVLKDMEKDVILKTVRETGSATEAAKILGISRATLYRKIKS
ncbi:sigma-54-dependent Fis family transcriptional regulator [Geovibrio ferrireducens]|uniref:sigma-54-dependent Fis family transcriptional regulator n=1 Tax=Geovibrio ferrireducens TaxID=46201 RepID=UPI002245AD6A|nr:sigma 54-interacting transcriptional regulator [Geovibrio ferrireducens]